MYDSVGVSDEYVHESMAVYKCMQGSTTVYWVYDSVRGSTTVYKDIQQRTRVQSKFMRFYESVQECKMV